MNVMSAEEFAIKAHRDTNHMYDEYLPYEFHLRMAVQVCNDFKHIPVKIMRPADEKGFDMICPYFGAAWSAVWLHDTIEDARVSYKRIYGLFGRCVAELVFAVTNNRGRDRSERANADYYDGIRKTPGATFVKLCDRIANVQYSKLTKSRMFEQYKKEHKCFKNMLYTDDYKEMFDYLDKLFNE